MHNTAILIQQTNRSNYFRKLVKMYSSLFLWKINYDGNILSYFKKAR